MNLGYWSAIGALVSFCAACNDGADVNDGPSQRQRIQELLAEIRRAGNDATAALYHYLGGGSCPDAWLDQYAGSVDSLCAAVVPREGRVWFEADDGEPCWCACSALQGVAGGVLDSLAAARRLHDARIFDARFDTTSSTSADVPNYTKKVVAAPGPGGGPLLQTPPPTCNRNSYRMPFGDDCRTVASIMGDVFAAYPVFTHSYDESGDWVIQDPANAEHVAAWDAEDGELLSSKRMGIIIPKPFMKNPNVKGELLVFLVLHELGHVFGDQKDCDAGDGRVWEGDCDHWAATIGLRAVYSGPEMKEVSKAAEQQLEDYYADLYGADQVCGSPKCSCVAPQAGYPGIACRMRNLENGRKPPQSRPRCNSTWCGSPVPGCENTCDCTDE